MDHSKRNECVSVFYCLAMQPVDKPWCRVKAIVRIQRNRTVSYSTKLVPLYSRHIRRRQKLLKKNKHAEKEDLVHGGMAL